MERKATPQDISWFLDLKNNNQIDLEPPYQRNSVWNQKDREFYLDTIMNNYPCPAIFLYKDIDDNGKTTYRVIDGKQRLTTIFEFADDQFKFSKTSENTSLAGKLFSEIQDQEYKRKFWNYSLPVEQINTNNPDVIKSIFDRLNRNNKKLTEQELRNARYDGELYQYVKDEAAKEFWDKHVPFGKSDINRMKDHQFIAELVLLTLKNTTQGFNQIELDKLYSDYDEIFEEKNIVDEKFNKIKEYIVNMESANNVISTYYSTRSNFYSVWNLILKHINKLPEAADLANVLYKLMDNIKNLPTEELSSSPAILQYLENTKGAATDKKARILRLEALEELAKDLINENN